MQKARICRTAIWMDAAVSGHFRIPARLAAGDNICIVQSWRIELVYVQIGNNLVAVLDQGNRATQAG